MVAATTCIAHGSAARQVRAAIERRITLAEALASGDRRPAAAVLEDAIAAADAMLRVEVGAAIEAGEPVPVDVFDRLSAAVNRASMLAKMGLDHKLAERQVALDEQQGALVVQVLRNVLGRAGLSEVVPSSAIGRAVAGGLRALAAGDELPTEAIGTLDELVERRVGERLAGAVADELARRLRSQPPLAIGSSAASAVAGREYSPPPPAAPRPGVGDGPKVVGIVPQLGGQRAGEPSPPDGADSPKVTHARAFVRCPGCGQDRYAESHDQRCGWSMVEDRGGLWGPAL